MNPRQEIIQIFRTFFEAQQKLKLLAPEYRWTGMGNLLGDFGEFLAIEHYGLIKSRGGSDSYDATTKSGETVQIKANFSAKQVGIRGKADLLLVLSISNDASFEEVYFGSFDLAREHANYSSRDNKWMLGIQKLRRLNLEKKNQP
jgi:hypothetical protein